MFLSFLSFIIVGIDFVRSGMQVDEDAVYDNGKTRKQYVALYLRSSGI
jgi:hypothetical protein